MKLGWIIALGAVLMANMAIAQPVAIVLGVQGTVSPPVAPYVELAPGDVLTLAPGAVLTIGHYASCNEVTIHGGRVTVGADTLDLTDAANVSRQPATCPRVISPSVASVGAGVVLRGSAPSMPHIGLEPEIVIAGHAADVERLLIGRDGDKIADLSVLAGRVIWPAALTLSDGGHYLLVLFDRDVAYRVRVVADRAATGRVVLRLTGTE